MKLRPKILILVLGILVVSIAVLSVPLYWYSRSALEDELDKRLLSIVEIASLKLNKNLVKVLVEEPALTNLRKEVEKDIGSFLISQIEGIAVYFPDGTKLAATGRLELVQPQISLLLTSFSTIKERSKGIVSEIYQLPEGEYLKAAAIAVKIDQDYPVVLVAWGGVEFMTFIDQLIGGIFWITLISIVVAISLAVVFSQSLIRPVRLLSAYAKTIQNNIYSDTINLGRNDEFGDLNQSLVEMHNEIKENEQRNKQLLSGIAHEIKNPLGGMEIYSGLLKEELIDSETHQSYLEKITKELHRLKQIIFSYLDYARPPKSNLKRLAIESIVEDVYRILSPEINQKGVRYSLSGRGEVIGDESKLRSVFFNLLMNSLEAVGKKGIIDVKLNNRNSSVRVEISDNGVGIHQKDLERIFQPYYSTHDKGYGLGLAITKNIMDEMDGTIFVDSKVGKGTKFVLSFPEPEH